MLKCDICDTATLDPWHFSKGHSRHLHACDKCWVSSLLEQNKADTVEGRAKAAYQSTGGNAWHLLSARKKSEWVQVAKAVLEYQ